MSKVVRGITTSLDGFIAGPSDDVERLHDWLFSGTTRAHITNDSNFRSRAPRSLTNLSRPAGRSSLAGGLTRSSAAGVAVALFKE
jgi:hypothetical protein